MNNKLYIQITCQQNTIRIWILCVTCKTSGSIKVDLRIASNQTTTFIEIHLTTNNIAINVKCRVFHKYLLRAALHEICHLERHVVCDISVLSWYHWTKCAISCHLQSEFLYMIFELPYTGYEQIPNKEVIENKLYK